MQDSHLIFVPFVYKLMMKPFSTQKWSQLLQVWRSLRYFSDSNLAKSYQSAQTAKQIIKRFVRFPIRKRQSQRDLAQTVFQLYLSKVSIHASQSKQRQNVRADPCEPFILKQMIRVTNDSGSLPFWHRPKRN
jgi:hypothetical protein